MRTFIIGSVSVFVVGVVLSLYLVISREDIALMFLKGGRVSYPEKYYQAQYKRGERGPAVVAPLQSLELQKGNINRAIELLEEYVLLHPEDVDALKLLTSLYLQDQRREKYLQTLEKLAVRSEKSTELRKLVAWYRFAERGEKEEKVILELIKRGKAKERDYYSLASHYTTKGDFEGALHYLRERRNKFPYDDEVGAVNLELYVYNELELKSGKDYSQQIVGIIRAFINLHPSVKEVVEVLNAIQFLNQEDVLVSLREELRPYADKSPTVQVFLWTAEKESVDPQILAGEIQSYLATHPATPEIADFYIKLLVEQKDWEKLDLFVRESNIQKFPQGTLILIAEAIVRQNNPALAEELLPHFDALFLKENPLVENAFLLAAGKPNESQILQLASSSELTVGEKLSLMRLTAYANLPDLAFTIGKKIVPLTLFNQAQFMDLATIYTLIKKEKEGRVYLEQKRSEVSARKIDPALYYLALSLGETEGVLQWLHDHPTLSSDILTNLWSAATQAREYEIAFEIAENLYGRFKGIQYQVIYADSLLNIGRTEEGYQLFEKLVQIKQTPSIEDGYLKALVLTSKDNPERKVLMESLLQKYLADPRIPRARLQNIGFIFLEQLHNVEKARQIFTALSVGAPFKSPEVQTLFYIMGPRPTLQDVAWIKEQTSKASFEELPFWLGQLNYISQYETVIRIVNLIPVEERNFVLFKVLFEAYWNTEQLKKAAYTLAEGICHVETAEDYFKYAKLADDANLYDEERKARMAIAAINPESSEVWHNLAKTAFEQRDYNSTADFVFIFFDTLCRPICPRDYIDYFYLAEVYQQKEMKESALVRYWKAFDLFQLIPENELTLQDMSTYAQILFRIGYVELAYDWMDSAFQRSHKNPEMRASWGHMMMDNGDIKLAEEFLFWCD